MLWYVGESRNVYTTVTSTAGSFTITSAVYAVYDTSDNSTVASGVAIVDGSDIYFRWTPSESGWFVADIDYVLGTETFTSRQVIEVRDTL